METVEELLPSATAAGMRICTTSVPCDFTNARFVVLEATFDAGSNLVHSLPISSNAALTVRPITAS